MRGSVIYLLWNFISRCVTNGIFWLTIILIEKVLREIPENLVSDDWEATRYNIVDIRSKPVGKSSTYKPGRGEEEEEDNNFYKIIKQTMTIPLCLRYKIKSRNT